MAVFHAVPNELLLVAAVLFAFIISGVILRSITFATEDADGHILKCLNAMKVLAILQGVSCCSLITLAKLAVAKLS